MGEVEHISAIIPAAVVGMKQNILGMRDAVHQMKCGLCKRDIGQLEYLHWDPLTKKEYSQSAMCSTCQDGFFDEKSNAFDPTLCTCDKPCCEADVGVGVINCGSQHCPVHGEKVSDVPGVED